MLQVYCKNTGTSRKYPEGTSLLQMLGDFEFEKPYPIVSAKVNNVSQGLKFKVYKSKDIEFVSIKEYSGRRVYCRSLCFLLYKAAVDLFPSCELYMEYPISEGYFFHLYKENNVPLDPSELSMLEARMKEIVAEDMPFHRYDVQADKVLKIFRDSGYEDKVKLLETNEEVYMDYYKLGETPDYYYGRLVPSTGYLKVWGIKPYKTGFLLLLPDKEDPNVLGPVVDQPKTFEVFNENLRWNIIMGLNTVGDVNLALRGGQASELIQVAEALQEKKIIQIAEEIARRYRKENPVRIVLITGPSSSGKTTFCKKLSVQLKACGLRPISVSTDDYFVNREDTPKFPDGSFGLARRKDSIPFHHSRNCSDQLVCCILFADQQIIFGRAETGHQGRMLLVHRPCFGQLHFRRHCLIHPCEELLLAHILSHGDIHDFPFTAGSSG